MSKQFFQFNYRRNLVLMLIFLQLITVTSILLLSRINVERLIVDRAYDAMAKTILQSVDHARSFLAPAYQTSETLKTLVDNSVVNFNDIETVEKLFFNELLNNKNFAGVYLANDKGDFIYMRRELNNSSDGAISIDQQFQTKIIKHTSNKRSVTSRWRDQNFKLIKEEATPNDTFNAKERPWYKLATSAKQAAWTKPYTFFTSKMRGVTIATPFQNNIEPSGVIGIDIEVHELSSFLDQINTENYYIRINDAENNLVAETINTQVLSNQRLADLLMTKKGISNTPKGTFTENKKEYLFIQNSLTTNKEKNELPNWNVFTYAKTLPFLIETRAIESRNILIAAITLFLSILLSIFIASRTSKPVEDWMNQATTDSLTGLFSRHFFFNTGSTLYNDYTKNRNHHLAVMMIDVDHFKKVNDSYGHNIGDETLKAIANCIRSTIGDDELLARFGGEEFILLTRVNTIRETMRLAEDIRKAIEKLDISTMAGEVKVTVSIGVALTNNVKEMSFLEFIDHADQTLYESKNSGRNQVTIMSNKQTEMI